MHDSFTPKSCHVAQRRLLARFSTVATALICALLGFGSVASDLPQQSLDDLARTPPMGWNSWNKFGCSVSEELIRRTADAMVASGMKDAGYQYVIIDDCWQVGRDSEGRIQADPQRFPSGMAALAAYVHSRGLKFGLYSDAGRKTCEGRPGSQGYEFQDAAQYAAWGVDYLKYDWCNTQTRNPQEAYSLMSDALRATDRAIVFSMCEWGTAKPWLWARGVSHLWRTTPDIKDSWQSVLEILDKQVGLEAFAGPGHWNDPDMLEVGNGGMTEGEYRAHFSLWAMLAAPLMAGNDLASMDDSTRRILTHREIIAIDQDPLGQQGNRIWKEGDREVWARPLADGSRAVLFLNRGQEPADIAIEWPALGYPSTLKAAIRDLWMAKSLPAATGRIATTVEPHGVVVYRIMPTAR